MAGRLAGLGLGLYAKNLYALLEIQIDKASKTLAVKWDDEIVQAIALTRDGAVIPCEFSAEKYSLGINRHGNATRSP